jgi:hypothetical protein
LLASTSTPSAVAAKPSTTTISIMFSNIKISVPTVNFPVLYIFLARILPRAGKRDKPTMRLIERLCRSVATMRKICRRKEVKAKLGGSHERRAYSGVIRNRDWARAAMAPVDGRFLRGHEVMRRGS